MQLTMALFTLTMTFFFFFYPGFVITFNFMGVDKKNNSAILSSFSGLALATFYVVGPLIIHETLLSFVGKF